MRKIKLYAISQAPWAIVKTWHAASLLLLLFVLSCTQQDALLPESPQAVRFTTTVSAGATPTATSTLWTLGDTIGIRMTDANGAVGDYLNVPYATGDDGLFSAAAGGEMFYPVNGSKVAFTAYSPYAPSLTNGSFPVNISGQYNPKAIDILYAKTGFEYDKTSTGVTLPFKHIMSKFIIKAIAGSGITSLAGMSVEITGLNTTASFNTATGALTSSGNSAAIVPRTIADGRQYEAIILPATLAADSVQVTLIVDGNPYVWNAPELEFAAGTLQEWTLTVNRTGITAVLETITPWMVNAPIVEAITDGKKTEYTLGVSQTSLVFDYNSGNQDVTITAKKTVKTFYNGEYQVGKDIITDAAFTVITDGTGFSSVTSGNTINVTALSNPGSERRGTMTVTLDDNPQKTISVTLTQKKDSYYAPKGTFAGSNIYWDGTKLTFDPPANDPNNPTQAEINKQMKQGVFFMWSSLIGCSVSDNPKTFYQPRYNKNLPQNSTWTIPQNFYWGSISYIEEKGGLSVKMDNTYLNDQLRNTDAMYETYKGDICKYLSKTGAVRGKWRMPTARELNAGNKPDVSLKWYYYEGPWSAYGRFGQFTGNSSGTDVVPGGAIYNAKGKNYFPASGWRVYSYWTPGWIGEYGFLWTSSIGNDEKGLLAAYYVNFNYNCYSVADLQIRKYGHSVRCVCEEQ